MKKWISAIVLMCSLSVGLSQSFPEGIAYQAQVFGSSGQILSNANVGIEFNVRSTSLSGPIVWQETHAVTLNDVGHFAVNVGQGTSTGNGSAADFSSIQWDADIYFLEMLVDENNLGVYVTTMTQQLMAVPFAFHSKTTAQTFSLSELNDVDTTGLQVGDILEWDGNNWVPGTDNFASTTDTAQYAYYADSTSYADTASYAFNCVTLSTVDSSLFSYVADTANYAFVGNFAMYADTSSYADTATVALYALGNWGINGNDNTDGTTHFVGTTDSVDVIFKAFNTERMRIKGNGDIGIGTSTPLADFHVNNTDGVLFTGTFGQGTIPITGAGTRMMWYPRKGAFRSGAVSSFLWDDAFIGDYSFAAGYNARAQGEYSVSFGQNSRSMGEGAFSAGNGAIADGDFAVAAGHNPEAYGDYSVGLGRAPHALDTGSVAIGYHPTAAGKFAFSLGNYSWANGDYSFAMGYHPIADHEGSFIWNDKSDLTGYVNTTAANQFMVKASGGSVFYSSTDLLSGVQLLPGAGAWSTLSDRNAKENITDVDLDEFLDKLDSIDVYQWNYKTQDPSIQHIGPMAQDFYSAFGLGTDSTLINSGDFDGVNLLLLKALLIKIQELEDQNARLENMDAELDELRAQRMRLMGLLEELEDRVEESTSEE